MFDISQDTHDNHARDPFLRDNNCEKHGTIRIRVATSPARVTLDFAPKRKPGWPTVAHCRRRGAAHDATSGARADWPVRFLSAY